MAVVTEYVYQLVIAVYSAIKRHSVQADLVFLGDLSIQGNIKSMRSLAEPLQVAPFGRMPLKRAYGARSIDWTRRAAKRLPRRRRRSGKPLPSLQCQQLALVPELTLNTGMLTSSSAAQEPLAK